MIKYVGMLLIKFDLILVTCQVYTIFYVPILNDLRYFIKHLEKKRWRLMIKLKLASLD